jgi:hypothetical protein
MTIHKSKVGISVVIMPFAEEDYSRNLNKLWLDGRNGFWSAKVLVDNSSGEKALVLKQNQSKKAGGY